MAIADLYPMVSESELSWMISRIRDCLCIGESMCFAYTSYLDNSPYMDVYILEKTKENTVSDYQRFVITKNFYLTQDELKVFRRIQMRKLVFAEDINKKIFLNNVKKEFSELKFSKGMRLIDLLVKFYYELHRGGYPQEIFYKANLNEIAKELNYTIREINDIENDISKILEVPLKIQRMVNTEEGVRKLLTTKERRAGLKALYKRYNFLYLYKDRLFSVAQIQYLSDLIDNEKYLGEENEKEFIFRYMEMFEEGEYEKYMEYIYVRKKVSPYVKLPLYYLQNKCGYNEKELTILKCFDPKLKYDEKFHERMKESHEKGNYEYRGRYYFMCLPRSVIDVLDTAKKLQNCLWSYITNIIEGETTIIFMADNRSGYVVAALEINSQKEILQAYGIKNTELSKEMYEFVLEYVEAKGVKIAFERENI